MSRSIDHFLMRLCNGKPSRGRAGAVAVIVVLGIIVAQADARAFLGTRWNMNGPGNAAVAPPYGNGDFTWSVMTFGLAEQAGADIGHPGVTRVLDMLLPGSIAGTVQTMFSQALAKWTTAANVAPSVLTNMGIPLGGDGGGNIGAPNAAGNTGDIRVANIRFPDAAPNIGSQIPIDGAGVPNALAHAFKPASLTFPHGLAFGSAGGDVHFRPSDTDPIPLYAANGVPWVDDRPIADGGLGPAGFGTVGLFTVMLHEVGHALGLDHDNANDGLGNPSVMAAMYTGTLTDLNLNDIANIRLLYSPEPGSALVVMALSGLVMSRVRRRAA
ncbi:MAG: matrixin family metalloprotease [Tepidisphaeraceae bacterium]